MYKGILLEKYRFFFIENIYIQSNLDNSNADFSKLPDFSKTSDGPEIFLYCLLLNYYRFFENVVSSFPTLKKSL